jgi:hypothetical protein
MYGAGSYNLLSSSPITSFDGPAAQVVLSKVALGMLSKFKPSLGYVDQMRAAFSVGILARHIQVFGRQMPAIVRSVPEHAMLEPPTPESVGNAHEKVSVP